MNSLRFLIALILFAFTPGLLAQAPEPVFDVPRMENIAIDGKDLDWADGGFRVEAMHTLGRPDRTPMSHDGRFRLGWDDRGLLVLVRGYDDKYVEDTAIDSLYEQDSVELFLATDKKGGQHYQLLIGPGMAENQPEVRHHLQDFRTDEQLQQTPLKAEVARTKQADGYLIEALLPWSNLGIDPTKQKNLVFQIYVNDTDAPGDKAQVVWYPGTGTHADPSVAHRIRLSDKPSPRMRLATSASYPSFRRTSVEVVGGPDLMEGYVELWIDGQMVQGKRLGGHLARAIGRLDAPLPPKDKPYQSAEVRIVDLRYGIVEPNPVYLPDPAEVRKQAFEQAKFHFQPFVFTGDTFPRGDFEDPALVEELIGPYTVRMTFINADHEPVSKPEQIGRYGAVVEILPEHGEPSRRYFTLFRRPDGPPFWTPEMALRVQFPEALGLDPQTVEKQQRTIGSYFSWQFFEEDANREPLSAVLLAGLHETAPEDPAVRRLDPESRDRRWWHALRKKLDDPVKYNYFVRTPDGYEQDAEKAWPAVLFLHGAGERGNSLDAVRVVGLPRAVAKRGEFPAILIAPQCPIGQQWNPDALADLLEQVKKDYRIDPDRVYLTGISMGGYGSWQLAQEHPELFAAVAPVCGGGDPMDVERIKGLPIWAFHGAMDKLVPPVESEQMIDALKKHDAPAKLTIYPDVGHDSWSLAYDDPAFYEWMLSQSRNAAGDDGSQ